MKISKSYFFFLLLLLAFSSSCKENNTNKNDKDKALKDNSTKTMNVEKFYWEENINSPLGYPVEVYRGGLEAKDGSYVSLSLGPDAGNWGELGSGMSSGEKPVPNRLNVTWISYAENIFYDIDTEIDHDKMVKLFKEGYEENNKKWGRRKENYRTIIVGFAPGGVAVIWLAGAGKQVEIGRYQAEKITIPQEEIDKLDSHDKLLFDEANVKRIMSKESFVPLEVQKANQNKPIPFGLWDTYRKQYDWKIDFVVDNGGKVADFSYTLFNGERDEIFPENLPEKTYTKRAIPKQLSLGWHDQQGQLYGGSLDFNEKEIFNAFAAIYEKDPNAKATLVLTVNKTNTYLTVTLKTDDKTIALKENNINIFKSRKK